MVYLRHFGMALMGLVIACGGLCQGDDIVHFSSGTTPGSFPLVDVILDGTGIGAGNVESETLARTFLVPGSGPVELTFTVEFDGGSFFYEFGVFDISAVTADPVMEKQLYAEQALNASISIFDDRFVNPGDSQTITVNGGQELAFFIVPNNTIENFLAAPDLFYDPLSFDFNFLAGFRAPIFSVPDANPGQFDQLLAFFANDTTLFTFEDLSRAGPSDFSFADLAFTIDAELIGLPDFEPPSVTCSLEKKSLWPPNHKFVDIGFSLNLTDNVDPEPTYEIFVYSDEPADDQTGDGATQSDVIFEENGSLLLRAERKGDGDGRVYLILIIATDWSGNQSFECCTVTVPHSVSKKDLDSVNLQAADALLNCALNMSAPEGWFLLESISSAD